jgi:hypothetical protein
MTVPLAPRERERLAGVLSLLGSPVPGEVIAAATAADRMLKARGLTWHAILAPAPAVSCEAPQPAERDWKSLLAAATGRPWLWNARERDFLRTVAQQYRVTPRQYGWLRALADRARAAK